MARLPAWARWRPFLVHVVPLFGIFAVVIGSIVAGWATPTESAALGCVASLAAAAAYGSLRLSDLVTAARETAKISVMILFIIRRPRSVSRRSWPSRAPPTGS